MRMRRRQRVRHREQIWWILAGGATRGFGGFLWREKVEALSGCPVHDLDDPLGLVKPLNAKVNQTYMDYFRHYCRQVPR